MKREESRNVWQVAMPRSAAVVAGFQISAWRVARTALTVTVWLVALSSIAGCVSLSAQRPTMEQAATTRSVVDLVNSFRAGSEAGLIDPSNLFAAVVNEGGQKKFDRWWCSDSVDDMPELVSLVAKHCESRDGIWNPTGGQRGWCTTSNGEIPIYRASIARKPRKWTSAPCTGQGGARRTDISAFVVESSDGAPIDFQIARQMNFKRASEIRAAEVVRARARDEQARRQANLANRPKEIGDKVCRDWKEYVLSGYVESAANGKIKVAIVDAESPLYPGLRPGGFKQTIEWAFPNEWTHCDLLE